MGDHDTPASSLRHVGSLNGLSDRTNLVDLEEKGVAELLVDTSLDTSRVSDEEVISNNLAGLSHALSHSSVGSEVVLVKRIFDRLDRVVGGEISVEVEELFSRHDTLSCSSLLGQVVGAILLVEEL